MSSRGHTVIAALAAVLALLLATAVPAGAANPTGVGGYVTDADTGLPLSGSVVRWDAPGDVLPATTPSTGRYVIAGLRPGTTATVSVVGPTGWERATAGPLTIPADGLVTQNLPLRRDWATPSGGASASANDESGGAACGSGAAVDTDRATGWSASATRAADDPPVLTIQLPQTIDVRELVLNAGASCGHDAGTALGRYRLQTSPDGATWTTAADGELGAGQRGADVALTPTAGATGVRYVRLALLSAQDAAANTIDVRELAVHGAGPNAAPAGSVTVDTPRNTINYVLRLRAAFTDPDSTIVRYLWDFDGDGAWDQATLAPTVAHAWAGAGVYHVTVGARDFRGALGTASMDLRITDPAAPVEPVMQRKPLITFDPPDGIDLDARIACSSKCTFTARFVLSAKLAKRLHLRHRTIRTFHKKTQGAGLGSWTITLPQKTIKVLRRHHLRKVDVRVIATAVDQQHRRTTVARWVRFR
jgi:hypothetical protein